jgi:hypothetical protein
LHATCTHIWEHVKRDLGGDTATIERTSDSDSRPNIVSYVSNGGFTVEFTTHTKFTDKKLLSRNIDYTAGDDDKEHDRICHVLRLYGIDYIFHRRTRKEDREARKQEARAEARARRLSERTVPQ